MSHWEAEPALTDTVDEELTYDTAGTLTYEDLKKRFNRPVPWVPEESLESV